jgi:hypothetical protein
VTDHADHFLVDQVLGHRHGLFRFAGVIALDQYDFLAVDAARRVDRIGCRLRTFMYCSPNAALAPVIGPATPILTSA